MGVAHTVMNSCLQQFIFIAAIVSITPAIFAAAYICFICIFIKPCSSIMYFKDYIKGFVLLILMFAAFVAMWVQ